MEYTGYRLEWHILFQMVVVIILIKYGANIVYATVSCKKSASFYYAWQYRNLLLTR